jgi:rod shape-determining protein MreC
VATDRARRRTLTLSIGTIAVVVVLYVTGGVLSGLRTAANVVVSPFAWTVSEIAHPIGHMFAGIVNYSDVVSQNQKLRYELGQDQLKLNEEWGINRQLQQVSTQLNVPFVGSLSTIPAQVITISPTNFSASIVLSKGRDQGVLSGMPVVANGGLVGVVTSTTPSTSTVRLITDVNSSIGVAYDSGTNTLVVSGKGVNNGLMATGVPINTPILPGQMLTTDGLNGGLYPPGLPVARVTKTSLTPGADTYNLTLQPTANLRDLAYVDVVEWEPST